MGLSFLRQDNRNFLQAGRLRNQVRRNVDGWREWAGFPRFENLGYSIEPAEAGGDGGVNREGREWVMKTAKKSNCCKEITTLALTTPLG